MKRQLALTGEDLRLAAKSVFGSNGNNGQRLMFCAEVEGWRCDSRLTGERDELSGQQGLTAGVVEKKMLRLCRLIRTNGRGMLVDVGNLRRSNYYLGILDEEIF